MDASTARTPGILLFPDGSWRMLSFEELPSYTEMQTSFSMAYYEFIKKLLGERRNAAVEIKPELNGSKVRFFRSQKLHQQTKEMIMYQDAEARVNTTPYTPMSKWVLGRHRYISGNLLIANRDWSPFTIEFAALVAAPATGLGVKRPASSVDPASRKKARLAEDSTSSESSDSSSPSSDSSDSSSSESETEVRARVLNKSRSRLPTKPA